MPRRPPPAKTGPKPLHGTAMRRVLIMLDEASLRQARALGHGNASAGIRTALAGHAEQARGTRNTE